MEVAQGLWAVVTNFWPVIIVLGLLILFVTTGGGLLSVIGSGIRAVPEFAANTGARVGALIALVFLVVIAGLAFKGTGMPDVAKYGPPAPAAPVVGQPAQQAAPAAPSPAG